MNIEEYENQITEEDKSSSEQKKILEHIEQHRRFAGVFTTPSFTTIAASGRQTGRTTKMILQALTGITEGKRVYIIGLTHALLDCIRDKLHRSAEQLGLQDFTYLVRYLRPRDLQIYGIRADTQETLILYDHTCEEYNQRQF